MSSTDDDGWVFDSLVNFLHGAIWRLPVMGFIEEKSVVFDPDSYNNMTDEKEEEFRKIHEEYKALVDYMLTSFMEDLQVTPEQVEQSCRMREQNNKAQPESHITRVALEQLWAAEDFNAFRRLMTRKNIDLQLQSLELLVAKYGVLSPSLRPVNSEDDPEANGEEDFLQVVIRYTAPENTVFHSSLVTCSSKCCPPPPPSPSPPPPPPSHYFHQANNTQEKPPALIQTTADVECHHYHVEEPESSSSEDSAKPTIPNAPVHVTLMSPKESQILQQDEQTLVTGKPVGGSVEAAEKDPEEPIVSEPEEQPAPPNVSLDEVKVDEETAAEIASAAPEQHRILTAVRRALDSEPNEEGEQRGSPKIELPTVGSEEEIERRREYLRAQRDKLVALKKREREKQLSSYGPSLGKPGLAAAGPSARPKSAKAAQIALKSPDKIASDSSTSEKTLQARRALAQRLKQELVENNN